MNQQTSFTDYEYDNRSRRTRREQFLTSMDEMIPWQDWVGMIEPYYPKGTRGRKPIGVETMLRMYLMQNWFGLSDEGMEDAVYDSYAMKNFLGIDFTNDEHLSEVEYHIAARPSQNRLTNRYNGFNWDKKIEHDKSSVRCKVEHPFHIVKNFFHCAKTRYRGLKKNLHMFHILFASANLLMCARSGRQKDFCLAMG